MAETDERRAVLQNLRGRTLAAKLRELMPDIEQRIREGVRHQEIVDALNEHGGFDRDIKLTTLRSYLLRYRRGLPPEARAKRRAEAREDGSERKANCEQVEQAPSPEATVQRARTIVTPSTLREVRDERVDLDALSKLGKAASKPGR